MEEGGVMTYTPQKDRQPPEESAEEHVDMAQAQLLHETPLSDTEKRAQLEEAQRKLERLEAKTVSGAPSRAPKARVLDASKYEKAHPEKYVRYTSTTVPEKMDARIEEGFSRVDPVEAAKHGARAEVGPMILTEQPRELHEERVERQKVRNKELLHAHDRQVEAVAEAVVRQLHDEHGLDVPIERFLIKE